VLLAAVAAAVLAGFTSRELHQTSQGGRRST
jgi:hypothetical protein